MSGGPGPGESAEELFEGAPCGYLTTRLDGTITRVNRTFERLTGLRREDLVGARRLPELLTPGGGMFYETHVGPLLRVQGSIRELAVDVVCADGTRLAALMNATVGGDAIRATLFPATDRRRYEAELLEARRREHAIALDLQRSLLSGELPEEEGLEVGVAYRPAVTGLEVGGDWYDAFALEQGRSVGLVVGDVVGRGLQAAATMGQLRSATRAFASTGLSPGGVLVALDRFARRHQVGALTTLAVAEVDLDRRVARYACAGHPPPVLVAPGRPAAFGWEGRSLPLDTFAGPGPRGEAEVELAAGSMLVLYTDGLVERSDRTLDQGLERLLAAVEGVRDRPMGEVVDGLTRELEAPRPDDVCVLAVRVA